MKVTVHSLRWTDNNPRVIEYQKKVMDHFGIQLNVTEENIQHGKWIDRTLQTVDSDIFVFMDSDCVPLKLEAVTESIEFCKKGYLVGNAQVTNCIKAKHDIFCAPSFLVISKDFYNSIGKPSAVNNHRSDIAQEFTRAAVEKEKRLKMYFPTSFQSAPAGGIWRLSGYGYYGIGTIYDEKFYHLYQTRFKQNVDLFVETCEFILKGKLENINRRYDCKSELMGMFPIEDEYGH
jgi:hypothetical protein